MVLMDCPALAAGQLRFSPNEGELHVRNFASFHLCDRDGEGALFT
jgi:hypothetical protein